MEYIKECCKWFGIFLIAEALISLYYFNFIHKQPLIFAIGRLIRLYIGIYLYNGKC